MTGQNIGRGKTKLNVRGMMVESGRHRVATQEGKSEVTNLEPHGKISNK